MKIQVFFLLLSFAASESFSQVNKSNQVTNVHHYGNNITVRNFDGGSSSIYVNGNSATLFNSDGTQSVFVNYSTLLLIDGTRSSIIHNGFSSTVTMSDGTQFFVNHMHSASSCSTAYGNHTIMHTFGDMCERRGKYRIDVLIHMNWIMQKKAEEATAEVNGKEPQN